MPNLTTSGLYGDDELARLCGWAPLFGQINVSIDGVGEDYARVRGFDGFERADRAVVALRKATKHVGINCVVTRASFRYSALVSCAAARPGQSVGNNASGRSGSVNRMRRYSWISSVRRTKPVCPSTQ